MICCEHARRERYPRAEEAGSAEGDHPDAGRSKVSALRAGDRQEVAISFTVLAGPGLLAVIIFQVFAGLDYRHQEIQGLGPGYAPEWTVIGTAVVSGCS